MANGGWQASKWIGKMYDRFKTLRLRLDARCDSNDGQVAGPTPWNKLALARPYRIAESRSRPYDAKASEAVID